MPKTLKEEISETIDQAPSDFSVFVKHIENQEEIIAHRADELFPLGSTFKIVVLAKIWEQIDTDALRLSDTLSITKDRTHDAFEGVLPGTRITIRDLLRHMIIRSDNTSTDMLLLHLGFPAIDDFLRRSGLLHSFDIFIPCREYFTLKSAGRANRYRDMSLREIVAHFQTMTREERAEEMSRIIATNSRFSARSLYKERKGLSEEEIIFFGEHTFNLGTMRAICILLERIFRGELHSKRACISMLAVLKRAHRLILPKHLSGVTIAHKPGSTKGARVDAGIIYCNPQNHVLISCSMKGLTEETQETGDNCIANIAKAVYEHFNKK